MKKQCWHNSALKRFIVFFPCSFRIRYLTSLYHFDSVIFLRLNKVLSKATNRRTKSPSKKEKRNENETESDALLGVAKKKGKREREN